MFKKAVSAALAISLIVPGAASAASTYTVVKGDTLWKISVKTKTGLSEMIQANPQLKNPDRIAPGQKINIPGNAESAAEQQVVQLVNKERAKAGVKPLASDWELARVAKYKSQDMHDNRYFDHNSPVYGSPFNMMKNFGVTYKTAGENIAQGQKTPEEVMKAWMNSPGHRANILQSSYTHIGVGYVKDGNYWTQQFISK
ncbi:SafA/ExsA family spore coat assembly protein [Bacillus mangrovi]|uniref:SafA/ExsA family spore coat assembly protein n=1 Tax=Metabacillus mangrovi TaxID=1491830 RepID=A0A7X2S2Z8_9BACI|nr:SafA/ExsA family spore coat assembly protein [Metabacillus mangrovi]MTH52238.1 SafA/ExsA family spore coat assembly protein [Metabacillus mangrovi]